MPKRAVSFADDIETRTFKRDRLDIEGLEKDEDFDMPMEEKNEQKIDEEEDDKKKHHTLESDEEEEEDHKRLDMKKVEGQEETTMDFEGNIKITAFNMKEDLEEGHFDETGNFIYDKKEKDLQDAWLDGIDWSTVKKRAGDQWEGENGKKDGEDDDDEENAPVTMSDLRKKEIFEQLVELLKPNQTVAKALTELKKKKGLSAAEERKLRWAAKKAGKSLEETDGQKETTKLSGLADELISAGFMDAYEWHKEKIAFLLQKMTNTAVDDLDMFSDEPAVATSSTSATNQNDLDDEVKWEYKENDEPNTPIQGPFTSSQMADRQSKGELSQKGVAKRMNTPGSFNPVSRIDFDLYC
ncbi:unnamed protein product [Caenorhabditis angaria]|uniref:GYF domain-containing protein n=1 Tax=Caenorhabditis angaria TaxID=860376 RepID=A0A9P1IIZ4_9PELO|nr:unnamed protein product [Caenorhabditis angaria]